MPATAIWHFPALSPCRHRTTSKYLQSGFVQVWFKVNEMPNEFRNERWDAKLRVKCQDKTPLNEVEQIADGKVIEEITICELPNPNKMMFADSV